MFRVKRGKIIHRFFFQSHHLKCLFKFYFHCIFIIYLILFYVNDSVGLTKKHATSPRPLFYAFPPLHRKAKKSASRGRVLAFYRIDPCLSVSSSWAIIRDTSIIVPPYFGRIKFPVNCSINISGQQVFFFLASWRARNFFPPKCSAGFFFSLLISLQDFFPQKSVVFTWHYFSLSDKTWFFKYKNLPLLLLVVS